MSEQEDDQLLAGVVDYLTTGEYPSGCSENQKRSIRRKAEKFEVTDGELFYIKKVQCSSLQLQCYLKATF